MSKVIQFQVIESSASNGGKETYILTDDGMMFKSGPTTPGGHWIRVPLLESQGAAPTGVPIDIDMTAVGKEKEPS